MSTSEGKARRRHLIPLAVGMALAAAVGGCGNSLPRSVSNAPVLHVVTGLYPLAQAAAYIGQNRATVADVVPAGSNPFTYHLTPAQAAQVRAAGLAVDVGGGFQPSFEQAASGAAAVARLGSAAGGRYVWLDPASMNRAVRTLADSMSAADPAASALYRRNATALQAEISSLGIDYFSTLSTCPGTTLITPDDAFGPMAGSYGLKAHVVGAPPQPGVVASAVRTVQAVTVAAIVTEPWVDNRGVESVASLAHVRSRMLDTLAGAPAGGWPRGADYFALMERNLSTLSSMLGCGAQSQ